MNKFLDKLQNVTVKSLRLTADVLNGDKSISIIVMPTTVACPDYNKKKATKSKK